MKKIFLLLLVICNFNLSAQPVIDWSIAFNRGDTSSVIGAVYALDSEHVLIAGNGSAYKFGGDFVPSLPFTKIYPNDAGSLASGGVFIAKINRITNNIIFLTHIVTGSGTSYNSSVFDIDVDEDGNIYLVGVVDRNYPENGDLLPLTSRLEGHIDGPREEGDGLLVKLSSQGDLIVASYFGGEGDEIPYKVKTLGQNRFAIAGSTNSNDFILLNAIQAQQRGELDAFVKIYNADNSLSFSSLFGGDLDDRATALEIADNKLIIAGRTNSEDIPTTNDAVNKILQGNYDGWLAEINLSDYSLDYASYYGGQNYNDIQSIAHHGGSLYIAGTSVIDDYFIESNQQSETLGVYFKKLDATYRQVLDEQFFNGQVGSTVYANYLSVSEDGRVAIFGGVSGARALNFPVINRLSQLNENVRLAGGHTSDAVSPNAGFVVVWDSNSEVLTATQMIDGPRLGGTVYSGDFITNEIIMVGGSTNGMLNIDQTHSFTGNLDGVIGGDYALSIDMMRAKNIPPLAIDDFVTVSSNTKDNMFNPLNNDSDPDGVINFSLNGSFFVTTGVNSGVLSGGENGNMFYTPYTDFVGNEVVEYEIRDAAGEIATAKITIVVRAQAVTPASQTPNSDGGGSTSICLLLMLFMLMLQKHKRRLCLVLKYVDGLLKCQL